MKKTTLSLLFLIPFTFLQAQEITFTTTSIATVGSNRAAVDMNGDQLDDLVSITENNINIFYQQPDGSFIETNISTTQADNFPSWSLAAADYDGNGYTDLLYGGGNGVTFMKANDTGTEFEEINDGNFVFSQRSNFVDINNDGNLDAFVCHDIEPNVYYLNDGNGNFEYAQGGLGDFPSGGNYGSVWIDYDNDRDMDLFIAKCGGGPERSANELFQNDGNNNYTEVGTLAGLRDSMQTWSSAWGDFDNDGDMDVFVGASSGTHKLMQNNGDGTFVEKTAGSGIEAVTGTGIENVPFDVNNDGNLDIISNGTILLGNGDMTFPTILFNALSANNGAFGDLNNDGFIDLFADNQIYYNDGNDNNFVSISTEGKDSNPNGIGARIEVLTASGTQIRDVRAGEGFRFMGTLNTHFGIGTNEAIESITIYWPSGNIDVINNPEINTMHRATEGATLGLEDTLVSTLILYPNPTESTLNLNKNIMYNNAIYSIFDVTGKRIANDRLTEESVDVSNLNNGSYILRILNNGDILTQKFIKK